ncbi:MAG: hypothetical protein F6J93_17575 [Oscillatoria sp. SIO1A7]|nr:hypothetical protein [Oscillatoria sp. SIO1A7]
MNKRKSKKATIAARESDVPPEQQPPLFSLRYLEKEYSLSNCNKDEKAAFADTLHRLSQLSCREIKLSHRHGLGYEKIGKNVIRAPIPSHVDEGTNLIAFRFCGKAPMVCYRIGAVFYIIWLDRDFTLYPHS